MAEKNSCGDETTYSYWCDSCGETIHFKKMIPSGMKHKRSCKGKLRAVVRPPQKKKQVNVGEFKVDIDCSEALIGLKAVQREARKVTQALKELEEQQKKNKRKVLHIKVNGILSGENAKKFGETFRKNLEEGFLLTDDFVEGEVLEIDDIVLSSDDE